MKRLKQIILFSFALTCSLFVLSAEQKQAGSVSTSHSNAKTHRYLISDSQGKPVPGATVECWSETYGMIEKKLLSKIQTGEDGIVNLAMKSGDEFIVSKAGMALGWGRYQFGYFRNDDVVLSAPSFLAGMVRDEQGKGVAGAKVFATAVSMPFPFGGINQIFGQSIENHLNAITDVNGKFRIDGVPTNATAFLFASAPSKALKFDQSKINFSRLPYSAGQQDIVLDVVPEGVIEGKIVLDEDLHPVPVATVMVYSSINWAIPQKADCHSDGTFRIAGVSAGNYRLSAQFGTNKPSDWVADVAEVNVESGKTNSGLIIHASRGGVLDVRVVSSSDHTPVSDVMVRGTSPKHSFGGMTDEKGIFRARALADQYNISVFKERWNRKECKAVIENGKTNNLQIELEPPTVLKGIVRDATGKPAPGLPVSFVNFPFGGSDATVTTDENGSFETEIPRQDQNQFGRGVRCVFVRDVEHNLAAAESIEEDTKSVELKLAPAITISGHVVCDGKPVKKPSASLIFWSGDTGMWLRGLSREGSTPGQYEIPSLPTGFKYGVVVTADGYGQEDMASCVSADTEAGRVELETVELKLANLKVSGTVVDSNDKPVSGVSVYLGGKGQRGESDTTDKNGHFILNQVCEGQVNINCYNSGNSGTTTTEAGDTNVVVKVGERNMGGGRITMKNIKLSGIVNGTNGLPISGAMVTVISSYNKGREVKTDTNGAFHLSWSENFVGNNNKNYTLYIRNKDLGLATTHEITEDVTNVTVQLQKAVNVTGRVENEKKEAIKGAQVIQFLRLENSFYNNSEKVVTDSEGRFKVMCLPANQEFSFHAKANGYGSGEQSLTLDTGNEVELPTFVLPSANCVIAGQVVDQKEKPVFGVDVYINGKGQPSESATTDKNGHFHFNVCEGKIHLSAGRENERGQAIAKSGDTNILISIGQRSNRRSEPQRKFLKGSLLPDLKKYGLDATALPSDKALLLCLFDANQRPSRAIMRMLQGKADELKQKGIVIAGLQVETITEDVFKEWKESSHITIAVGRVEKRETEKWLRSAESLPWLVFADAQHKVLSEGFPFDELDNRIGKVVRAMALKARGPSPSPWTQSPGPIRVNTATLNGMVAPNGTPSKAWFRWGTATHWENTTPIQDVGSGSGVVRVSAPITGLVPEMVYRCQLVAVNTSSGVTNFGPELRFTTGMRVVAWGASENGNCKVPVDLTNAVAVACGHGHSLAIRNDGTVAFWGGEGSFAKYHPIKIPAGLSNVVAVAGGYAQSYAVKEDGSVVAWGEYLNQAVPTVPEGLHNVIAIAAGDKHAIALKSDGTVIVWGSETENGETQVPEEATNVVAVASGSNHCIALRADGTLVEWGLMYSDLVPDELEDIASISAEAFRFLALQKNGVVLDWGVNDFQHLPSGGITNAVAIAAGLKHSSAILKNGTVMAWGQNEFHQLDVPENLFDVVSVAASDEHTIALGKLRSK